MTGERGNYSIVLTPPGTGAIAVVRVCGPDAPEIVAKTWSSKRGRSLPLDSRDRLHFGMFMDGDHVVDDVVVAVHEVNRTRAVDISAHGGIRVVERILQALERLGAPLADKTPGRASVWPVANTIEAEAVRLMARARTARGLRFLAWQRARLVPHLERIAAGAESDSQAAGRELASLVTGFSSARILIEGATVALVGPPNSGKSTLFNRLVGRSAAIVSARAGTTRDWVAQPIEMDGIPVTLVDTAGQPAPGAGVDCDVGALERRAIEAGRDAARRADLCLLLFDGGATSSSDIEGWRGSVSSMPHVVVGTKLDRGVARGFPPDEDGGTAGDMPVVRISARTGAGMDGLVEEVVRLLIHARKVDNMPCFFTARQVEAGREALAALPDGFRAFQEALADRLVAG